MAPAVRTQSQRPRWYLGISYAGFYTAAGIIDTHPAIKAASPQAPVADLFLNDDWYHGGAFMLAYTFDSVPAYLPQSEPKPPPKVTVPFDYGTNDGYEFFLKLGTLGNATQRLGDPNPTWNEIVAHSIYDAFWQSRAIWRHLKNIRCAVLTVGGWFDAEDLMGPLRVHQAIKAKNPGIYNGLVMGPWVHGGWARHDGRRLGSIDFAADTARFYREKILLPFFEHHLKDGPDPNLPGAYVFETGTNVWRRYPEGPPQRTKPQMLYFRGAGGLAFEPSTSPEASDAYVSDPTKPVPFIGYTALAVPEEYMVGDQRFAATRPDVLVYVTEPLAEDLTLAGPVSPKLFVSTTGTDSDWVVKLIDVYPPDRSTPATKSGTENATGCGTAHGNAGRLPTARARRAVSRQVSQEFRAARAVRTREGRGSELHNARCEPRVSPRPPRHGPCAEQLVSARGSQSANLRQPPDRESGGFQVGDATCFPLPDSAVGRGGVCAAGAAKRRPCVTPRPRANGQRRKARSTAINTRR